MALLIYERCVIFSGWMGLMKVRSTEGQKRVWAAGLPMMVTPMGRLMTV
jgi:hypothetical protein